MSVSLVSLPVNRHQVHVFGELPKCVKVGQVFHEKLQLCDESKMALPY